MNFSNNGVKNTYFTDACVHTLDVCTGPCLDRSLYTAQQSETKFLEGQVQSPINLIWGPGYKQGPIYRYGDWGLRA